MSVESGELRLNVVADTSGLAADLKAKLARVKQGIKVDVKLNTTQIRAELASATRNVAVNITPRVNATELRAALAAATRGVTVTVTPKVNVGAMRAALASAVRDVTVNARVDFDRAQVQASFAAATAGLRVNPIVDIDRNKLFHDVRNAIILAMSNLPPIPIPTPGPGGGGGGGGNPIPQIRDSASSLLNVMNGIGKAATIAVGALALFEGAGAAIVGVVGALTAVVNGLYAITAASGAAIGALVAIPAALSGLVGVVGTLLAGFKGVGGAIQGLQESQQNAGKVAQQQAKAQRSAAQAVEAAQKRVRAAYEGVEQAAYSLAQAQRSVRDAAENVADAQRNARNAAEGLADAQDDLGRAQRAVVTVQRDQARAVAAAETAVANAYRRSTQAQESLSAARKDAIDTLDDYQSRLANAALSEEGAALAVIRARKQLNDANTDPSVSTLDRQEADLAYREALQRLKDVQKSNQELGEEAAEAGRKGVEGSDGVKSATEEARVAAEGLATAQENQVRAIEDRAEAEAAAAEAVVDAQRNVRDAYENVAEAQLGIRDAIEAVEDAQHGYTQAQRGTVKAAEEVTDSQRDLIQAQKDASAAIKDATGSLTKSQEAFLKASPAAQDFARFIVAEVIPALKDMQEAVQNVLLPDLETALRNLIPVAEPFTEALVDMAGALGDGAIAMSEMFASPEWTRDIVISGENNARTIGRLFDSMLDILDVFRNVTVAAQPMIDRFTDWFGVVTDGWKATAELNRENGKLADYFQETGDVIAQWARIVDNIVVGIGNINDAAQPAGQALLDSFEGATADLVTWSRDNSGMIGDYFNAIVPVVESMGRIFVNMLAALTRLSSNPATLRITELIESRLGPALDTLLTALLDSGSGEVFVELMADLLDILTGLVNSGGLKDVLEFLEGVATSIANFGNTDEGSEFFRDLILVAAIGGPLLLVAGAVGKIYNAIAKIAKLPRLGTLLGKIPKSLIRGGLVGAGGAVVGGVAGGLISDGEGGVRDVAGGAVQGAATGAGIGAGIGMLGGPIGVGAGAAIGAGVGGLIGAVQGNGGIEATMRDIQDALRSGFDSLDAFARERGVNLGNLIKNPLQEIPNVVSAITTAIPELFNRTIQGGVDLFGWIGEKAREGARAAVNWIGNIPVQAVELLTFAVESAPAVFDWILDQATTVIDAVIEVLGNFAENPVESIGNLVDFLGNVATALFSGISSLVNAALNVGLQIILGILEGLGDVYKKLQPALGDLARAIVDAGVQIMGRWNKFWYDIARIVADKFVEIVSGAARSGADLLTKIQEKLWLVGTFWTKFWQGLKDWASQKIGEATLGILSTIGNFYSNITGTLSNIGRAWNNFWDGLKAAAANPIKFVIDTVINGGIGNAWRKVDGFLGNILPDWKDVQYSGFKSGGVLPGYTPGRDVHMFSSPTAGNLALSGGEAIMRPEWTRAVGGPAAVEAMNKAARSGATAFANGGVWGPVQRFANGGVAAVLDFGRWLRTQGYDVGENRALGDNPRPGVHSATGYHYRDGNSGAIDVNAGAGTSLAEQIKLAKAVNSARTRGLRSYFFTKRGDHKDHAHFDYGKGDDVQTGTMPKEVREALTTSAGGLTGGFSELWDDIKGKAGDAASALAGYASNIPIVGEITNMMSALKDPIDGVNLKSIGVGVAQSLGNSVKNFLSDKVGGFLGSGESSERGMGGDSSYSLAGGDLASSDRGTVGKGVERWRATALRALEITNSPASWVNSLLRRMMQESGGNQRAINNWDVNAKRGTPSKGLMQVIDPTFRANAMPGYNTNIYDPLSNIIASIRYANRRYGNAPRGWDRKGGYKAGGVLDIPSLADGATIKPRTGGTLALLAERGKSETVVDTGLLNSRLSDLEGIAKLARSSDRQIVFQPGSIVVNNPVPEPASKSVPDRLRAAAAFGMFDQS